MAIGKQSLSRVKNAVNGGAASLPQNATEPITTKNITPQEIKPTVTKADKKPLKNEPPTTIVNKKTEIISVLKHDVKTTKLKESENLIVSFGQNLPYYLL